MQVAQTWVSRHRSWEPYKTLLILLKMFKYQHTEMGVEPPSILESRCSALSSQCQVPECLRFQMFPTWQISRTLVKNGKSIVNPQIHASMWFCIKTCLLRGFVWETMLLAGDAGVHSVNRHAKCCPVKQDTPKDSGQKSSSGHVASTSWVLKSLVIFGFLPEPHYNITEHNARVQSRGS